MTPEAQRIAIAAAVGTHQVRRERYDNGELIHVTDKNGLTRVIWDIDGGPRTETYPRDWVPIPDYLNSLDAMHEAVMSLDGADRISFAAGLYDVAVPQADQFHDHFIGWPQAELMINATTAQRAEAFLRTLNLWTTE